MKRLVPALMLGLVACGDAVTGPGGSPLLFSDLSVGPTHACAVSVDGKVYCWGSGERGELGNRPSASSDVPVAVVADRPVIFAKVSAGYDYSCGMTADGLVLCWGTGSHGELGNGFFGSSPPVQLVTDHRFASITGGWYHACGIAEGGLAYCWGLNSQGQLGDGTLEARAEPTAVAGGIRFAQLSAGGLHTCGVALDGTGYCWGANDAGQLGTGEAQGSTVPARVAGNLRFSAIAAGYSHSCGVAAGQGYCWGSNVAGELGNRGIQREGLPGSTKPGPIAPNPTELTLASISAGHNTSCAITTKGAGYCWGAGVDGQTGSGFFGNAVAPFSVAAPDGPAAPDQLHLALLASGGLTSSCALTVENVVYCWGRGPNGELGAGAQMAQSPLPVRVAGSP